MGQPKRRNRRSRSHRASRIRRWWRIVGLILLGGILASVILVLVLRWFDPPYSAVMLQRFVSEGGPQHQTWVDLEQIHPEMALAVVAAEDQRFPDHWGFDTEEILAAVESHLDGGRLRGASTISQQVARNIFLWQGRSYLRKGLEIWFTGLVELFWPKRRILEMYLNFAEMGVRVFGVGAASKHHFGVSPDRLGRSRATAIAAILPNPAVYSVAAPTDYVRERRKWIARQMKNLGGPAYLVPVLASP